jgi:hypothetical protein
VKTYKSKYDELPGSSLDEILALARHEYHLIQKKTPRRVPYVRSTYFMKNKVFINNFWEHLNQKPPKERILRLKFYRCAIDLLRHSNVAPDTIFTYVDMNIGLHRFYGQTRSGHYFCVQVKANKRTGRKDFMSVFPVKKLPEK